MRRLHTPAIDDANDNIRDSLTLISFSIEHDHDSLRQPTDAACHAHQCSKFSDDRLGTQPTRRYRIARERLPLTSWRRSRIQWPSSILIIHRVAGTGGRSTVQDEKMGLICRAELRLAANHAEDALAIRSGGQMTPCRINRPDAPTLLTQVVKSFLV